MSFALTNTSRFYDTQGGTDWWQWKAFIEASDKASLDDIEYVEYQLHSSFRNPIKKSRNAAKAFAITNLGWGTFMLRARVVFKDKSKEPLLLEHYLEFENSVARDD
ncbi:pYEATS domain-containing protein [Marinicella meishanensis]|uniref:pYEATS domain-containing protein n=1 Tax=Marinicella meishanensis TaxID=2873263 RepID=UPI001CBFF957|nr:pYEATS domain-containing protein [Marinicella sp. NBU2979]